MTLNGNRMSVVTQYQPEFAAGLTHSPDQLSASTVSSSSSMSISMSVLSNTGLTDPGRVARSRANSRRLPSIDYSGADYGSPSDDSDNEVEVEVAGPTLTSLSAGPRSSPPPLSAPTTGISGISSTNSASISDTRPFRGRIQADAAGKSGNRPNSQSAASARPGQAIEPTPPVSARPDQTSVTLTPSTRPTFTTTPARLHNPTPDSVFPSRPADRPVDRRSFDRVVPSSPPSTAPSFPSSPIFSPASSASTTPTPETPVLASRLPTAAVRADFGVVTMAASTMTISSLSLARPVDEDEKGALEAHMLLLDAAASILSDDRTAPSQPLSLADLDATRREQRWLITRVDLLRRKTAVQQRVRDAAVLVDKIGETGKRDSADAQADRHRRRSEAEEQFLAMSDELVTLERRLLETENRMLRAVVTAAIGGGVGGVDRMSARQRVLIPDRWDVRSRFCSAEQLERVFEPALASVELTGGVGSSAAGRAASRRVAVLEKRIRAMVRGRRMEITDGDEDVESLDGSLDKLERALDALGNDISTTKKTTEAQSNEVSGMHALWDVVRATELEFWHGRKEVPVADQLADPRFSVANLSAVIQHLAASRSAADKAQRETVAEAAAVKTEADLVRNDLSAARAELSTCRDDEIPRLERDLVRIQTALTICRAELDAGSGPRSERMARDVQLDGLAIRNNQLAEQLAMQRVESDRETAKLKREMAGLLTEFETVTAAALAAETDRAALETKVDEVTDKLERVESELAEQRMGVLGRRDEARRTPSPAPRTATSPGPTSPTVGSMALVKSSSSTLSSPPRPSTSTSQQLVPIGSTALVPVRHQGPLQPIGMLGVSPQQSETADNIPTQVLRAEFKKMMRDVRAEGLKALRVEQTARKKLEAELRALRIERIGAAQSTASTATASIGPRNDMPLPPLV